LIEKCKDDMIPRFYENMEDFMASKIKNFLVKIKNSPNRDNYILTAVIIWGVFLLVYVSFFE